MAIKMRTEQEIIDYLGLEMDFDTVGEEGLLVNKRCIEIAKTIENKYAEELKDGDNFGYAFSGDINRFMNEGETFVIVERIEFLSVYKKVRK